MRLKALVLFALTTLLAAPGHAVETWREAQTGMEFVQVPKGCFQMGAPADAFQEDDKSVNRRVRETEVPQHEVCLDSFWMGRYEVRRGEWAKVMGGSPSPDERNLPVAGVSRADAEEFTRRLSARAGEGAHFRLPTEAEWEYACRAGAVPNHRQLPTYYQLDSIAWYSSPYGGRPSVRLAAIQPVGTKAPNAFGLHDMLGNVWEWVQDDYLPDGYARHSLYNPVVTASSGKTVIRGGGLRTDRRLVRCGTRAWLTPEELPATVGFRLVRASAKK